MFSVIYDNENNISQILKNSTIKIKHYKANNSNTNYNSKESKKENFELLKDYKKIYKYIELNNYNFIDDLIKDIIYLFQYFKFENIFDEFIKNYKELNENLTENLKDKYLIKIFEEIKNSNIWNNHFIIKFIIIDKDLNKNKYKEKYFDLFQKINVQKINQSFVNLLKEKNFFKIFDDINDIKNIFNIFYFKIKDFFALYYLIQIFIDIKEINLQIYLELLNNIISNKNNYFYYKNEPLSRFLLIFLNKLKENNKENEIEIIFKSLNDNIIEKKN